MPPEIWCHLFSCEIHILITLESSRALWRKVSLKIFPDWAAYDIREAKGQDIKITKSKQKALAKLQQTPKEYYDMDSEKVQYSYMAPTYKGTECSVRAKKEN